MDLIDVGWALFFEENVEDENEYLALIREQHVKIQNFYENIVGAYSINGKKNCKNYIIYMLFKIHIYYLKNI